MNFPSLISLDIETYGILEGQDQTVFHPRQSEVIDHIPRDQLIVTVALSYYDSQENINSGLYVWNDPQDRHSLHRWFQGARFHQSTLLGQNLIFDLTYLRHCDPTIHYHTGLHPNGPRILLDDLMIINFLEFEERPEKSLKPLSLLLGLTSYHKSPVTAKKGNAANSLDPNLHLYNVIDSVNTLKAHRILLQRIREKYGLDSPKLSSTCKNHRDQLLRILLTMRENGIHMSIPRLQNHFNSLTEEINELNRGARAKGVTLSGKGSDSSKRDYLWKLLQEEGLLKSPSVEWTEKERKLSIRKSNLEFALTQLRALAPLLLHSLYKHTGLSKLLTGYYKPLLNSPPKGILSRESPVCYPSWHPVPSSSRKGGSDSKGTIQGRITCTKPGAQTFPSEVNDCMKSRFLGGRVLSVDFSQLERVIAAFLSQDSVMLDEWDRGVDSHSKSGLRITNYLNIRVDPSSPEFRKVWRFAGKTLNFLVQYRGGASKYRETLIKEAAASQDFDLLHTIQKTFSLDICRGILLEYDREYKAFRRWQDSLIQEASETGYLELPTGWSRRFPGGRGVIEATYINEICNFPVQCLSAQIVQNAQFKVYHDTISLGIPALITTQTYDSITFDYRGGRTTRKALEKIFRKNLTRPPLYVKLQNSSKTLWGGPVLPLLRYEIKEVGEPY